MREIRLDDYEKSLIGFAREIVYYLRQSGVTAEQAEDVVQDVFVKMLESDFIIPEDKMRAWMYRVSIRRYIDKYRRDRHYMDILRKEFLPREDQVQVENEDYDFLLEELEQLPSKERVLLDLYYFQGFSVAEIANILSYSQSRVKVGLMRSRKKLKIALEKKGYQHGKF